MSMLHDEGTRVDSPRVEYRVIPSIPDASEWSVTDESPIVITARSRAFVLQDYLSIEQAEAFIGALRHAIEVAQRINDGAGS